MRIRTLLFVLLLGVLGLSAQAQQSCGVLLIWDSQGYYTPNLVSALQNAGFTVTLSATDKSGYNGTNPSPYGFGCVILLDGTTYSTDIPAAGQQTLVAYVQGGGGFVETEWAAYDLMDEGYLQYMRDLILFDRLSGVTSPNTYTVASGMGGHPVLAGVPASFSFQAGFNVGPAHTFAANPVTVLMTDSFGNDAVAVRQFGAGHVVGFNHAGNYNGNAALSNANIQTLFVNAVNWSCGTSTPSAYDLSFMDDYGRSQVCVSSATGDWQWTVLKGNGAGNVYTGAGTVLNGTGYMRVYGNGLSLVYYTTAHRAAGALSFGAASVSSALFDVNTADDKPYCGGET